jgi:hypothetical protein
MFLETHKARNLGIGGRGECTERSTYTDGYTKENQCDLVDLIFLIWKIILK